MPTHDLTTHHLPITTLHPHPDNPRNGDTDAIAESLRVNGQYRPIVATSDGTILAGNHTYMAAVELGWETISVVTLDVDPGSVDAVRIMLADNRTADLGGYDDGLLLSLLDTVGVDLLGSGFTDDDVDRLRALVGDPFDADDFPEPDSKNRKRTQCPQCGYEWSGGQDG